MQMRETSTSEGGNYSLPPILPSQPQFPEKTDGIFYIPQSWDMGHIILLPFRRKAYWGFF
jgi:hypothetical protein